MAVVREAIAAAEEVDDDNPWPGLEAFRESEQRYFRGRELKIRELLSAVARARLTVLHGLSGLGKTSLLQAGLFARLAELDIVPVPVRLSFLPGAPDLVDQIKAAIPGEIRRRGGEASDARLELPLWAYFHRKETELWTDRNRPAITLIAIDQLEEIFTVGRGHPGRDRLLAELGDLIEGRVPAAIARELDEHPDRVRDYVFNRNSYKLLLALREDYLSELEDLRRSIPSVAFNRVRLTKMNGDDAREVVRVGRGLVDPAAEEPLLRFVAGPRSTNAAIADLEIDPALLSVLCRELNQKRRASGAKQITEGLLVGREEILNDFYSRALEGLDPSVRRFIEENLLTSTGFRNPEAIDNVLAGGISEEAIHLLVDRRLVRIEERGGTRWLELTHDVLTKVVQLSRDERRGRESAAAAVAQAQREAAEARARAEESIEQARVARTTAELQRRVARQRLAVYLVAGCAAIVVAGLSYGYRVRRHANQKVFEAYRESMRLNTRLVRETIALQKSKNAVETSKNALVKTLRLLQRIGTIDEQGAPPPPVAGGPKFEAESRPLGPDSSGKAIYQFRLRLRDLQPSVVGVFYQVRGVQPRFRVGVAPSFEVTFQLRGCRLPGTAVVSYDDRDPVLTSFDLCALIEDTQQRR